jgi:hypothetical protein
MESLRLSLEVTQRQRGNLSSSGSSTGLINLAGPWRSGSG